MRAHAAAAIHWRGTLLIVTTIVSAVVFMFAFWLRSQTLAHTNTLICQKVHQLDQAVSLLISDSVPTVSELNRLAYYRNHPAERADVIRRARIRTGRQLRILAKGDCNHIP